MPEPARLFEPETTFGVGELVARVSRVVASAFPAELWVRGEIHGYKRPNANGHVYFDLCERNNRRGPATTMPVALFRDSHQRVQRQLADYPGFTLGDGLEVRIRGQVKYGYGRVQLVMSAVDPVHTLGKLAADRQRVLAALAADGLLTANKAHAVPLLPLRVGLVTSVGSAAYEDTVQELTASGFGFTVVAVDARVQGAGAELSMVRALHRLQRERCDVVLLVRGGGARTDLVAFDGERLARAVAAMPVPVFVGVGHEIDTCVVDEVAHTSLKTPTACAAAVVDQVRRAAARVETVATTLAERAGRGLGRAEARLDGTARRIPAAATRALDRHAARLDLLAAHTSAADPVRLLARGWTLTRRDDGTLVRGPADAEPGTVVVTTTAGGPVRSRVE